MEGGTILGLLIEIEIAIEIEIEIELGPKQETS